MKHIVFTLVLICFSSIANAAHLLGGGRGALSNNSATFVGLVPESEIVGSLIRQSYAQGLDFDQLATMEAGSERIYTVPSQCYTFFAFQEQLDAYEAMNEPCEWHFDEGEHLHMHGFMDHYIPTSINQSITWTIFNDDGYEKIFTAPDVSLIQGLETEILVHVDPPADLVAGEYEMTAKASQYAPDGFVFYQYFFVSPTICFDDDPFFGTDCYIGGEILGDGTVFTNVSAPTKLSILAVSVSAPLSSGFLVLGLLGLYFRRNA